MNKSTIQTLIDKVIGKKGLIRVPSWWMRKVLMQMADWVQEGDDANGEKIVKVKEEADGKISTLETNVNTLETNLNSEISYLKNLSLPYMLVSGTGIVNIDGNEVSFTDTDKQLIYITGTINFKKQGSSKNNQIIYTHIPHLDIRSQGRDMSNMFYSCSGLTSLDLSGFDTSAVTSMTTMFCNCRSLTSLDLSSFDTSAVTGMASMFSGCSSLTTLDVTGFNTSAVTSMASMFFGCSSLTSLDLTGFNTSAVTNMVYMFRDCSGLTSLDLSGFNTSAVTNMGEMFNGCKGLTTLDVTGFNTSAVTSMASMFSGCSSLTSLDLTGFDTSAVMYMGEMFRYCSGLTSLDLSGFDTSAVTNMGNIFSGCSGLTSLILGPNFFKTPNVTMVNFSYSTKWINDTVVTSLVTNSYDRATAGLRTMTLQLSANTKAALTDEQKAAITAKGYTIA